MTEQQPLRSEAAADSGHPAMDVWREEIHSRVSRFRTRRGRRIEGAFSMRFPFPPPGPVASPPVADVQAQSPEQDVKVDESANQVAATTETVSTPVLTVESPQSKPESLVVATQPSADPVTPPLPQADPWPQPAIQPRPRPKRKVIAFPRQAGTPETVHRLADPVLPEQPRILDVPEELEAFPTTPFLDGLQCESATRTSAVPPEHIELPFRSVSLSQRLCAALVDCSLVAVAAIVFALISHKMLPNLAFTKPARITAALLPILLWAIYQYLLLVYAGRTVGMQVATIRLTTFKGRRPSLRHRRNRVLGLYLSTASLVMGLLWALVDADALCWHDRISGTYLTKQR
jgi:uncharacterized RDD family membrane protein YckC